MFQFQFTKDTAIAQGCVGWVMNTYDSTVKGVIQGQTDKVEYMLVYKDKLAKLNTLQFQYLVLMSDKV